MKLIHERVDKTPEYTESILSIGGSTWCLLLEDPVRVLKTAADKIPAKTAIPPGEYEIIVDLSKRFSKMMPHILNVPFFDGIRCHSGEDVDDTEGCPLMGLTRPSPGKLAGGIQFRLTDHLVWILQKTPGHHTYVVL